jgi:hypothetical protein
LSMYTVGFLQYLVNIRSQPFIPGSSAASGWLRSTHARFYPSILRARESLVMAVIYSHLTAPGSYSRAGPRVSRCGSVRVCGSPSKISSPRWVDRGSLDLSVGGRCGRLGGGAPLAHGRTSHCSTHYGHARRRRRETLLLTFPSPFPLCPRRPLSFASSAWFLRCSCALCAVASFFPHGGALPWIGLR